MRSNMILVVDGDEGIRRLLTDTFSPLGYMVVTVISPEHAMGSLSNAQLIISEIRFDRQETTGLDFLSRLQSSRVYNAIPVIVYTTHGKNFEPTVKSLGAKSHIVKGMQNIDELTSAVQALVPPTSERARAS
jgi:DNA-binding NtrC family response regulator